MRITSVKLLNLFFSVKTLILQALSLGFSAIVPRTLYMLDLGIDGRLRGRARDNQIHRSQSSKAFVDLSQLFAWHIVGIRVL